VNNPREVLKRLKGRRDQDVSYDSGKVFCSMCSKPLKIAVDAYSMFLETNLLDPKIFPSAKSLEEEAIQKIGALASNPGAAGYITSGGTEGNIVALWVARKLLKRKNVVAPASAHYSITKACDLQQLNLVHVELDETYRASVDSIRENVSKETLVIVVTAGTTALGLVDPIEQIGEIAQDFGCFLHVDASFGGFVLSFIEDPPPWDFRVAQVSSLTLDPHKMGLAPIPAGSILFREKGWLETIKSDPFYLNGSSSTLLGTRPGASAAAVWALLTSLGQKGYQKIVRRCMSLTRKLARGIKKVGGLDLIVEPELNVVAFKSDIADLGSIREKLEAKGWLVSTNRSPKSIRLVVMPHHRPAHIRSFLADLNECLEGLA
jgi:tyrosine decarboxylase/aspartate 1-decarboxylase